MDLTGRYTPARSAHQITWFAPDRPVDGGTVYKRPALETAVESSDALPESDSDD